MTANKKKKWECSIELDSKTVGSCEAFAVHEIRQIFSSFFGIKIELFDVKAYDPAILTVGNLSPFKIIAKGKLKTKTFNNCFIISNSIKDNIQNIIFEVESIDESSIFY